MGRPTPWSELPGEIVFSIAKLLDTDEDSIRIRAVCSSWRTSIPPPERRFPLQLTLPVKNFYCVIENQNQGYFKLCTSFFYHLKLPSSVNKHGSSPYNGIGPSSCQRGWLVRVEATGTGSFRVLNPFGGKIGIFPPQAFPDSKQLNTLDFRISEVTRSYNLKLVNNTIPRCREPVKVILSSRPASTENDYIIQSLTSNSDWNYIKLGEDEWSNET
ncbi:putative F-box protein At5g60060, partial [Rutidosis leptorrhynchoides]|uniref:putative F-box protein At5g60060 n=1 Tax=Rutidosis leptorrhynchoides TaxID=125765 RepID=UPI003A99EFF0